MLIAQKIVVNVAFNKAVLVWDFMGPSFSKEVICIF